MTIWKVINRNEEKSRTQNTSLRCPQFTYSLVDWRI